MRRIYRKILDLRVLIFIVFGILAVVCAVCSRSVSVNYDINDYLPDDSDSTIALDVMEEEFDGGIPNVRVMVEDVSLAEALEFKDKLEGIDGVTDVTWLDDAVSIEEPLEMQDQDTVETYYKDGTALFSVTVDEDDILTAVPAIREMLGEDDALAGSAVSTEVATNSTVSEIMKIVAFAVVFTILVLLVTTDSWLEPVIVLGGLGIAIIINSGTNLIFGEISFVTNAAGNILQLAVSLDYSVFLMHRFEECRLENEDTKTAMVEAMAHSTGSISSSGLTTVIGFLALVLMRFKIGPDLGLALAKGVAISLVTTFTLMPCLIYTLHPLTDKLRHRSFMPTFRGFAKGVRHIMIPAVVVFCVIVVPARLASTSNEYYYGASKIFGSNTELGADTEAIEAVFGKSDTYVLLVPKTSTAVESELSDELWELPQVTSIISYVDTVGGEIPESYLDEDTLSQLNSENYTRMVLSLEVDYEGDETFELVENIRALAEKYYPGEWYLAGQGVSTYDLKDTVTDDMLKVNLLAIAAVFAVILLTTRSLSIPVILVLSIETAIWMNLAIQYFAGNHVFYIAYLIISSIQLGATVDYAILFTDRYKEFREICDKKTSVENTVMSVMVSILTSSSVLAVVGFLMGFISTHGLLSQLGYFLGFGALCSLVIVVCVLPGLLYIFDGVIQRTTKGLHFCDGKTGLGSVSDDGDGALTETGEMENEGGNKK